MWICQNCNEELDDSFDVCWKCQEPSNKKEDIEIKLEDLSFNDAKSLGVLDKQEVFDIKTASRVKRLLNFLLDSSFIAFIGAAFINDVNIDIILVGIWFMYYLTLEMFLGRTFGKFITGTKVVNSSGEDPTFFKIFVRTICRLIPFEILTFLGSKATGLHDIISDTRVINL